MFELCALVEGPSWADTEFYGKWLLATNKANKLLKQAISDPIFDERISTLTNLYIPDFCIRGTVFLSRLAEDMASVVVSPTDDEFLEEFAMMIELGFFVLTGQRYQMVVPKGLTLKKVQTAALRVAATEDDECYLHLERIITMMPLAEAKAWQSRLSKMDPNRRKVDREILLGVGA